MWKKIRQIIKLILFFSGIIILGVVISAYIYKDRIISQLIREANKQINTPVRVEHIDLDFFKNFPKVSVNFEKVSFEESWPESVNPLLLADHVFIALDPISLLTGNYEINQVHVEDAEFFIRINKNGENNFTIISARKEDTNANDSLVVDLKKISLKNVTIHYQDENSLQEHLYYTSEQEASLTFKEGIYNIRTQGDLKSEYIRIQGKDFAKNKSTRIVTKMQFDPENNLLLFEPSQIEIRDSHFSFSGEVHTGENTFIDLKIEGIDTDIQSLISLLPENMSESLKEYRSKGDVYFKMSLNGYTKQNVEVDIQFGLKNAELSHPKISKSARGVYLTGRYFAASFSYLDKSTIELSGVKGIFGSYPFEGALKMRNLSDPVVEIELTGTFEMEELLDWMPESRIEKGTGLVHCQLSLKGRINDLKSRYTSQKVITAGEVKLDDVVLSFKQNFPLQTKLTGNFVFSKNDLAINNTSVQTGHCNWTMNGYFRNILPFLLFKNQFIGVEADINSGYLDIEDLLPPNSADTDDKIRINISPFLLLDFNCKIGKLKYRKFEARKLTGDLKVKESKIFAQNIDFNSMGGHLKFSGLVNASGENIAVTSSSHWENLSIDSVFYVFNNFNQDWLVMENLKGHAFADVLTDMTFSPELTFFSDSLIADISIAIIDGELNDFEPMIELEKYVEDENLAHLRFSELRNDIHVENRKIYLPQMEIRSNVSNILVSGSHTFDQEIDYRVVVPMKTLGKSRNGDMFGAVVDDSSGSKLHLKIVGTTENYQIKYDAQGVKNKVVTDLKKEVEELKDAFRKKETRPEEVILNEEEFFEWDEDTTSQKPGRLLPY